MEEYINVKGPIIKYSSSFTFGAGGGGYVTINHPKIEIKDFFPYEFVEAIYFNSNALWKNNTLNEHFKPSDSDGLQVVLTPLVSYKGSDSEGHILKTEYENTEDIQSKKFSLDSIVLISNRNNEILYNQNNK